MCGVDLIGRVGRDVVRGWFVCFCCCSSLFEWLSFFDLVAASSHWVYSSLFSFYGGVVINLDVRVHVQPWFSVISCGVLLCATDCLYLSFYVFVV